MELIREEHQTANASRTRYLSHASTRYLSHAGAILVIITTKTVSKVNVFIHFAISWNTDRTPEIRLCLSNMTVILLSLDERRFVEGMLL